MALKTAAIQKRAANVPASQPAKAGNGRSVQRKILPGLLVIPPVQRKEHAGNWVHRQPQKHNTGTPLVQPKVKIHAANDHFEKEADHVADKVVSNQSAASVKITSTGTGAAQRKAERTTTPALSLQRNSFHNSSSEIFRSADNSPPVSFSNTTHPLTNVLSNQSTRGSPLPSATRRQMETRMGASFSNVRIHTGQESHDANTSIGARAFTNGRHIHFANGQFNPKTRSGQHLLAHELTHTIQQGASPSVKNSVSPVQRSTNTTSSRHQNSTDSETRGPPLQTKPDEGAVQCSLVDTAVSRIGELLNDLPSITEGIAGAKRWLMNKARRFASFIPGYTALGVVMGQDPITGERIERNGRNFINAALDIIPGGALLKQKLEELGAIDRAATWIDQQLETLAGIVANIRDEFTTAWNALGLGSIIDGPLNVLRNLGGIFERAINRLISFAERAASELLSIVKQFLLTQVVDFIKNHTTAYELLKVVIGHDPVTEEPVARNGTNILNALLELGGEQGREQRRQMQDTGTFQKAADWIDRGIAVFGNLYQTIRDNFGLIWNAVSIESLMHPVDTFNRIYEKFAEPVRQVLNFVEEALRAILSLIKEVLLQRLSAWARTVRGYSLVTVLIGKDPFTNEVVPRTIPNIIKGFMSLMEGGEEQYRQMEESGAIARTTQQINAAVARLNMTPAAILQLFIDLWNSFSFNDLAHPIATFQRIINRFGEPIARLIAFVIEIVKIVIHVILEIMNFPFGLINNIITRAMAAFERIKRDPIGFLRNLMRAVKQGFIQFFNNILTHLLNGLTGWLMSELRDANVPAPTDFSLRGIIGWVLQVLGISMEAIWQKLAAHPRIGPERVARLRGMIDRLEGIWTFIRDVQQRGIAAIWDKIQEQLSNLWNTVLDAIKNWVMERIITQVTTKLLSMLDPTGIMAIVNSAIAIYKAVQSFIRYLRQMLEVVNSFVNGVADIAEGNIATAANYLERTMDRAMPIVIGFLANQVGLGGVGRRIGEMIMRVREMVDRALTWLVNKAVDTGFALFDRLMAMGREAVGGGGTPQQRLNNALQDGQRAVNRFAGTRVGALVLNPLLTVIKLRYGLQSLEVVQRADKWAVRGRINPEGELITNVIADNTPATANTVPVPVSSAVINHNGKHNGFSNGVKAEKLTNNGSKGSRPTSTSVGAWDDLNLRRQGNRAFYVKGHLLNSLAGGPGTWDNLVPMFQNHNTAYEARVETLVKQKYDQGKMLYFEAVADYRRPENPHKQAILDAEPDTGKKGKLRKVIEAEVYVPTMVTLVVDEWDIATNQRKLNTIIAEVDFSSIPSSDHSDYTVQTKLKHKSSGDHHEREADHIADKVVSGEKLSSANSISKINTGGHQNAAAGKKPVIKTGQETKVEKAIATQQTRGSPLPVTVKTTMENKIGADFSNVRIHADHHSNKANESIGAKAFTQGANIHFAKGEFKPETKEGAHLLAHELVHTVQQGASSPKSAAPHANASSTATEKTHGQVSHHKQEEKKSKAAGKTKDTKTDAPAEPGKGKTTHKKSPSSPEEDPAFQRTITKAKKRTTEQRSHLPASLKANDAQSAAKAVPGEAKSKAQNRKTDTMEEAGREDKSFNAAAFKEELLKRIEEITPKNLEEANDFKENNRIHEVKAEMGDKVAAEKQNTTGPVSQATSAPLAINETDNKQPVSLPPTEQGGPPVPIGAKNAIPKSKTEDEISMQDQSDSLDEEMKANNISEGQLQGSNEPSFQAALKEKKSAQKDAVEKPLQYKKDEAVELKSAGSVAITNAAVTMKGMHHERGKEFAAVVKQQGDTGKKDEEKRAQVAKDINDKYAETEKTVKEHLDKAESESNRIFDSGSENARAIFEDYVGRRMDAYKDDRYSGLIGKGRWLHDKLFDMPDEVNVFYTEGKNLYLGKMDEVLTSVANVIAENLNNAKNAVTTGKKNIDDYVAKLPEDLQGVGKEAADNIQDKFDSLEQSVNDKGHQLIDGLARKYVDNVKKLDDRIKELKEANKGLVSKAIGLLKEVWKVIKNIYELFKTILSKLVQIVGIIIGAPGKFFSNLGAAFSKGFDMFKSRLGEHLENGLMLWLSSQLGVADLKLPDKFDFASVFALVLQVLGVSYAHIRERAVLQIGEERVALLETTAGIFQRIYKEGLGAVWDMIKEKFTDFKDMIWEAIKTFIKEAVIKAALTFLLSLLNPVAAFVKACMAIYDFLMMLVRMKDRILDLLNSILDAVISIANGAIDGAAAAIEKALAKSIPVIIGFLAALLHLNDIGAKVRDIILRIRARVDKLIDWLIGKAYALIGPAVEAGMQLKNKAKQLVDKGKEKLIGTGKAITGAISNWWKAKKNFSSEGENHALYFDGEQQNAKLMIASKPATIQKWLDEREHQLTISHKLNSKKASAINHIRNVLIPEINLITHVKDQKQPRDANDVLNELATNIKIIGVKDIPPVPPMIVSPGFSNTPANGSMMVKFLFKARENHSKGEPTTGKESLGGAFDQIENSGVSAYWSRGHILNKDFGGKAVSSNLIPIEQSANVKQVSFDNEIRREYDKKENPIYILFKIVRNSTDNKFVSDYFADAKKMNASGETWSESGGDNIAQFEVTGIKLPGTGKKISIKTLSSDSTVAQYREVGKANNLSVRLLMDIVGSGSKINSAKDLKNFIEKNYTGVRKQRYLNRVETAITNKMLDFS